MSSSLLTLACGPYLDEDGLRISVVLFLVVKPLAYFAFIQAFRYRVSRPIPMRWRRAVGLTVYRAGLGLAIIGIAMAMLAIGGNVQPILSSWIFFYAARMGAWWLVGAHGAGLRGRRLAGWIISGTLINITFDVAMIGGLLAGWMPQAVIMSMIAAFIAVLHVAGRRLSLKLRFADWSRCHGCGYDLAGNLSGVCPECGTAVGEAVKAVPAMAGEG
ncbi:MAG: hypothetical protein ACYTGG_05215 [Planctomycetota bacterium]